MSANPLVAERVDTTTPFAGTLLLEDGEQLVAAVENGDWVSGGMALFSGAMDTVAAVSDPMGTLFAMGLGWVIDHVSPLNEWLEDLTGDADQVAAFAATWANVATSVQGSADELARVVAADLADMDGLTVVAYRALAADMAEHLDGAGRWASGMSTALQVASTLVQIVHDVVRDAIAQVLGAVASYAVELVATAGLATPLVIEQAATRAAALATRVGRYVTELLSSFRNLQGLIDSLRRLMDDLGRVFDDLFPGQHARTPDGATPRTPDTEAPGPGRADTGPEVREDGPGDSTAVPRPVTPSPLPDIADLEAIHPKHGHDVMTWATEVAARHDSLTPDEVAAIYHYTTDDGYDEMNTLLRSPASVDPVDAARIQAMIDDATSGMAKITASPVQTMRGTDLPPDVLATYVKGDVVSDPAFWSTSTEAHIAHQFRKGGNAFITIDGVSGVDVQRLSHFGHEAEILVPPGTQFLVKDRTWNAAGYYDLVLEEVR